MDENYPIYPIIRYNRVLYIRVLLYIGQTLCDLSLVSLFDYFQTSEFFRNFVEAVILASRPLELNRHWFALMFTVVTTGMTYNSVIHILLRQRNLRIGVRKYDFFSVEELRTLSLQTPRL